MWCIYLHSRSCCTQTHTYALYEILAVFLYCGSGIEWTSLTRSLPDGFAKSSIITVAIHKRTGSTNLHTCCVTCVLPLFNMHGPNNGLTQHVISQWITAQCHWTCMYIIRMNQACMYNIIHEWSAVITHKCCNYSICKLSDACIADWGWLE